MQPPLPNPDPETERIQALADAIERDKVRRAVEMDPGQKLMAGPMLYDLARSFTLAGIRMQNPDADEQVVRRLFRERLDLAKQTEENSFLFDLYHDSLVKHRRSILPLTNP